MSRSGWMVASLVLVLGLWALRSEAVALQTDLAAEKAAVEDVVGRFFEAMETLDVEQFSAVMAHDLDTISFGTDAAEIWVGWESMLASVREQFAAFESARVSIKQQTIHVNDSGEAAWFASVLDWTITSGGEPVDLAGTRVTGVLEKRDGKWLVVQMHASVPVAGQAVEY